MTIETIFFLQFTLSLIVTGLLAKWLLAPWLAQQSRRRALFWLTIPHAFRHIGMVFLVPGVVLPLPENFASAAAYGDLAAGILALFSLIALHNRWKGALGLVWVFNIVGTLDLINALRHLEAVPSLAAAWYIPTFLVPLLLVTHLMIFATLVKTAPLPERSAVFQ